MSYEFYNAYRQTTSNTPSEEWRNGLQSLIDDQFENASDYYTVKKKNRTTNSWEDIGVRISKPYDLKESTTMKDDYRKLVFANNDVLNYLGDSYEFNGYRYLTIDTGRQESPTNSCLVRRCNIQLKFTQSTPLTQNIICIDGVSDASVDESELNNPKGTQKILIPNDSEGQLIKISPKPTRFLMGNKDFRGLYQAWTVQNIDSISYIRPTYADTVPDFTNGLISIRLAQIQDVDNTGEYDDHTLGVAWQTYFGRR